MLTTMATGPPILTLFCGLPGSGKTTLARALERAGRGVRICTDDWQAALGADHADDVFHERLQARLYDHAIELLRAGQGVILEDGLWRASERAQKRADAAACHARTELHLFDLPVEEVWRRLAHRNVSNPHGAVTISRRQLEGIWRAFQWPSDDELPLFDAVTVHGADEPAPRLG
jgi:predicted kinase